VKVEIDLPKDYLTEVGERIKKARLKKDLSLEKFGLEIGLTRMQVHRIEKGYNITLNTLLKIAIALEVKPDFLLRTKNKFTKSDLEKLVHRPKAGKGK
jgi:transcriptional regulator with XRE-family HTH domain